MTSRNYAYQTLDDIVFEGRNREYGAYLLRKIYTTNLWRGLVTATTVFVLFLSLPLLVNKLMPAPAPISPPVVPKHDGLQIIDVVIPPLEEVIPPADVAPPVENKVVKTEKLVNIVIKKHVEKPTTIPEQETLSKGNIGTETTEGEATRSNPVITETTGGKVGGEATTAPVIHFAADQMPEFPGGLAAMNQFLADNIEYPALAKRNGLEGMVILSFVVNQQGDISGIQVLKTLGGGTEAEAIRVLKSMPKWSPGKNKGIPVNVRFTLPVRFKIK